MGRVIRHKDDYGAVILCDNRFAASHFKNELSAWIRPYVAAYNKFGPVMKDITQFFKQAKSSVGMLKGLVQIICDLVLIMRFCHL